jgi:hypothetical protein
MNTTPWTSDSDANMARLADVLPVLAHATRLAPTILAWVNAAVIPLSLKLPDGFIPSVNWMWRKQLQKQRKQNTK